MHTMRFGPRMLVINTKNKQKEDPMFEEIGAPPSVINSFKNAAEELVKKWYETHSKKKLKTQTQEEELQFFPAPPVLLSSEEEE